MASGWTDLVLGGPKEPSLRFCGARIWVSGFWGVSNKRYPPGIHEAALCCSRSGRKVRCRETPGTEKFVCIHTPFLLVLFYGIEKVVGPNVLGGLWPIVPENTWSPRLNELTLGTFESSRMKARR